MNPSSSSNGSPSGLSFPVVGLGASAGGLQALIQCLESLPADPDMAFVGLDAVAAVTWRTGMRVARCRIAAALLSCEAFGLLLRLEGADVTEALNGADIALTGYGRPQDPAVGARCRLHGASAQAGGHEQVASPGGGVAHPKGLRAALPGPGP